MKEKIKKILLNEYSLNIFMMITLFCMFYIPELIFRAIYTSSTWLFSWSNGSPNLYTFSYIIIFLVLIYFVPLKKRKIFYTILLIIEMVLLISQSIHYEILGRFYGASDLINLNEGSSYFLNSFSYLNPLMLFVIASALLFYLIANQISHKIKKVDFKYNNIVIIFLAITTICSLRVFADYKLAGYDPTLGDYYNSVNFRFIYDNYDDNNKSLFVSGLFEYTLRNPYIYLKKEKKINSSEKKTYVDNYISENKLENNDNDYTGIFENKNLIYIMLESVDNWLVNKDDMPNLYKLSKEGIDFKNRYSVQSGSGYTLNTEFALNTGFYSTKNIAAYEYANNDFSASLPNMFKNKGYTVNSIHANSGTYYSRTNLHNSFGYENHYDLDYIIKLTGKDNDYKNDYNLVKEPKVLDLMLPLDNKFVTFFTTYSVHLPYQNNEFCDLKFKDKKYTEIECIKYLASITDDMIGKLVDELKVRNLYDDTVIVVASDHHIYGYSDKKELHKLKGTDDVNLIENVPFIIWSSDLKAEENEKYLGTADIPVTLFNMFNIDYEPNNYLGTDIFDEGYENYVFFMDNSYYDGTYYNEENKGDEDILKKISERIKFNDSYLKSNYYSHYKKSG